MNIINIIKILLWSATPILEQRFSIPLGIFKYNMHPFIVFLVAYLGSLLPVPFILLMFNKIFIWLKKYRIFGGIYRLIERKINKNRTKFEKYEEVALITFIAIPLPTTGVWTGTAVAAFLGLDFKKSFMCAAIGAFISAIIITVVCIFFPAFLKFLFIK